jgi:hypothetical protein
VTLDRSASTAITGREPAPSAPSKSGSYGWLKWALIGGSIITVGGVAAWLVLRPGEQNRGTRNNGMSGWLKHKIGLAREDAEPRENRRRRRKGKRSKKGAG